MPTTTASLIALGTRARMSDSARISASTCATPGAGDLVGLGQGTWRAARGTHPDKARRHHAAGERLLHRQPCAEHLRGTQGQEELRAEHMAGHVLRLRHCLYCSCTWQYSPVAAPCSWHWHFPALCTSATALDPEAKCPPLTTWCMGLHSAHLAVHEVRVEAHAGGNAHWQVAEDADQKGGQARSEGCGGHDLVDGEPCGNGSRQGSEPPCVETDITWKKREQLILAYLRSPGSEGSRAGCRTW
jgi:hypothetical protein